MSHRPTSIARACLGAAMVALAIASLSRPAAAQPTGAAESAKLLGEARELELQGKLVEAIAKAEQAASKARPTADEWENLVKALDYLAQLQLRRSEFPDAVRARQQALDLKTKFLGQGHWRVTSARLSLDDARTRARLSTDERPQLASAAELRQQAAALYDQGNFVAAAADLSRATDIASKALGKAHPDVAEGQSELARIVVEMGRYADAQQLCRQALESYQASFGKKHPVYAGCVSNLARVYRLQGDYPQAEKRYHEAAHTYLETLGEKHPGFAASLRNLAFLYKSMGDYEQAEPLYRQSLDMTRAASGEKGPEYARGLNTLAAFYTTSGDYRQAEKYYSQSLEIEWNVGWAAPAFQPARWESALKLDGPANDRATSRSGLALVYRALGDDGRAVGIYQEILNGAPDNGDALGGLAKLYQDQGDLASAEKLLQLAIEGARKRFGEEHREVTARLRNLAGLYRDQQDFAKAEPLFKQATAALRKTTGSESPDYLGCVSDLARVYALWGKPELAVSLYQQVADTQTKTLGVKHPAYLLSRGAELAAQKKGAGRRVPVVVERLVEETVVIDGKQVVVKRTVQETSERDVAAPTTDDAKAVVDAFADAAKTNLSEYTTALENLSDIYAEEKDYQEAAKSAREAVDSLRHRLDLACDSQSATHQLSQTILLRGFLDKYLSLALRAKIPSDEIYREVSSWKGTIFAQQIRAHWLGRHPDLAPMYADLRKVSLTTKSMSETTSGILPQSRIDGLEDRRNQLIEDLTAKAPDFRRIAATPNFEELKRSLGDGTALVDLFQFTDQDPLADPDARGSAHLLVFVTRAGQDIGMLDLPIPEIEETVDAWHAACRKLGRMLTEEPALTLRRQVWEPIRELVRGGSTVLVSPDGPLATIPWAALPGEKPNTYLVEDEQFALGMVPVPNMMAFFSDGAAPPAGAAENRPAETLLLVGAVDFGKPPAPPPRFKQLEETKQEVVLIENMFKSDPARGTVTLLTRDKATRGAIEAELGKHQWVHLATHGISQHASAAKPDAAAQHRTTRSATPSDGNSVLAARLGLGSALVFAGVNQADRRIDECILTAARVSQLDLSNVRTVVLSACDSGTGKLARGEGILGLQRAFQVAGARSVIASLWPVEDAATRNLMVNFYTHLWDPPEETPRLGKLAALRQAQLDMLANGKSRGLTSLDALPKDEDPRLPPYFWAGFVLSGDWR